MREVVISVVLALVSCSRPPGAGTVAIYEFPPGQDSASCDRSPGPGYPDPETLVQEYVTRDGAGRLFARGGMWYHHHFACPGHYITGGTDAIHVVSEARIDSLTVTGPVAKAYVSYRRLGFASGGHPAGFTEALANINSVVEMVHLNDGWWLFNNDMVPHPLASTILARPDFDWPDSLRTLIERLAKR